MAEPTVTVEPQRRHRYLLWLLVAGAAVRLLLWTWFQGRPPEIYDEKHLYSAIAKNLVDRGEFALIPGEPSSNRPPLYPAFVAGIYRICGVGNYDAVRLIQAALSLFTVVIVYQLGRRVYSPRVGLWAAGFTCFYPSLLVYNNLILAEVLFTLLLCSALFLIVLALEKGSLFCLAAAGAVLGLAALTRSVLWLYPPLLVGVLVFVGKFSLRRRLLGAAVLVAVFSATLAPWAIRNTLMQHTFTVVDAAGGRNFMMGNYRDTPMDRPWHAIDQQGEKAWHQQLEVPGDQLGGLTQGQIDKLALHAGLKFVLEHPGLTLERDVFKFFHFWQLERELPAGAAAGLFGPIPSWVIVLLSAIINIAYIAALLTSIFGILLSPPQQRPYGWILLSMIVFIMGMHTLSFGHSRYHLPLMPVVLLYSAAGLVNVRQVWSSRNRPIFFLAAGVCGLFMLSWVCEFAVSDRARWLQLFQ
jgi:4-amino-4-deoxy-L-arabinose transferase-like glycosyltransferase